MADKIMWTPDLSKKNGPIYLRLVEQMEKDIKSGVLTVGDKLPAQRQLAWHLNINLSTVTKAFQIATQRQLISGEVGRGTYILRKNREATLFNLKKDQRNTIIDLSTHIPAINPDDQDLENCLTELLRAPASLPELLQYHSPAALERLRIKSSQWLCEFGYNIDPHHCVAIPTAQMALMVALLSNCRSEDTVLVNTHTFPGLKAVARQLKLKLHAIEMDEQGITPDSLLQAIRTTHAKVLVSDPILQNPTAVSMNLARQEEILAIIEKHKLLFIEEYVIGSLSDSPPISNNLQDHSIVIISLAKSIAPGLRFACIAGKHPAINTIINQPHATSWQLSPLTAEIACRWIEDGTARKRLKWQRNEVTRRHQLFKKLFRNKHYTGNNTVCSHTWLPVTGSADDAQQICHKQGVEVVASGFFAVGRNASEYIRVSLTAAKSMKELKTGLTRIIKTGVVKTR